jgi:hypothetical protein
MQSIIRKIKSLPILAPKPEEPAATRPTHSQLLYQIDLLDKLIDIMIQDAKK